MGDYIKMSENLLYEGVIEEIIFQNDETGFMIANLNTHEEYICIKGILPFIKSGDKLRVSGKLEIHPIYGEQLTVNYLEHVKPKEREELFKYLSSGVIKGIGEATAQLMMQAFGDEALEVIHENPERLLEIPGIGP